MEAECRLRICPYIELPRNFNAGTMYPPIMRALNSLETSGLEALDIDFKGLKFIEPVGVVILSNLIEYVIRRNVRVTLSGLSKFSEGTVYLDNSGFFERYLGCKLRPYAKCPPSCSPLTMVSNAQAVGYLHASIIPWLSDVLRTSEASLATIRVCLDEVFSNINFHSGVDFGCMHIQQFKQSNEIQIAISDFGVGIPSNVRRIRENINDSAALKLACEEGFTTQSNVKNVCWIGHAYPISHDERSRKSLDRFRKCKFVSDPRSDDYIQQSDGTHNYRHVSGNACTHNDQTR